MRGAHFAVYIFLLVAFVRGVSKLLMSADYAICFVSDGDGWTRRALQGGIRRRKAHPLGLRRTA